MNNAPTSTLEPDAIALRVIERVGDAELQGLADVLVDCVEGGASVSFMLPIARERALAFWRGVAEGVARGDRVLLVAEDGRGICGTVQVQFASAENQPHRGEVAKMLVHRRARRRGVGESLMRAAEREALARGRTVLVLDTGDATAARLYARLGWQRVGEVPGYALHPGGGPCTTTFYYRALA